MQLTDDELSDATETWWNHPITKRAGHAFGTKVVALNIDLRKACANTTDPRVAAAYARLIAYEEHVAFYKARKGAE